MASVVLTGDTSGQVTLSAPAIAGTNTITLPAATGTAALTSDIGQVLLGTLTTTSGATQTLSGLNLTSYKSLYIVVNNVSFSTTASLQLASISLYASTTVGTNASWGTVFVDLTTGAFSAPLGVSAVGAGTATGGIVGAGGNVGITTSSTSLVFSPSAGNFDAGTITVYGIK